MGFIYTEKIPVIKKATCFGKREAVVVCSKQSTNNESQKSVD